MLHRSQAGTKLVDSVRHGAGCELFLVEGDSAARSVAMVRDEQTQAVLPLQGKPLNAWRATPAKVAGNALYLQLADALGLPDPLTCGAAQLPLLRYERLMLLFDPDADGIHIGALMLLYLHRFAPVLIGSGRVHALRAPTCRLEHPELAAPVHAYSQAHAQALLLDLAQRGLSGVRIQGFRGLGSIPPETLQMLCVDPATRHSRSVGAEDVAAVGQALGLDLGEA